MTKFAYCDVTNRIRRFDTAKPILLPVAVYDAAAPNVTSVAFTAANEFVLCGGFTTTGHDEIRKVTGTPKTEELLYKHPTPIRFVRVRSVGGADRIYFSVAADFSSKGVPQRYDIYYLKAESGAWSPILYVSIDPATLAIPDPCSEGEWHLYEGDFAFGDNDTLYLSSGGVSGCDLGVFQMSGAGPDSVTGAPHRIHLGPGPIRGLYFQSPQSLYFLRRSSGSGAVPGYSDIWKLDLGTMTEALVGQIPGISTPYGGAGFALDIVEVGDALPQAPPWWFLPSALYKWLIAASRAVLNVAEALNKPVPHPDPRWKRDVS